MIKMLTISLANADFKECGYKHIFEETFMIHNQIHFTLIVNISVDSNIYTLIIDALDNKIVLEYITYDDTDIEDEHYDDIYNDDNILYSYNIEDSRFWNNLDNVLYKYANIRYEPILPIKIKDIDYANIKTMKNLIPKTVSYYTKYFNEIKEDI
jgi:hypothetical protein